MAVSLIFASRSLLAQSNMPAGTIQKGTLTNTQLMRDAMVEVAAKVGTLGCGKLENFIAHVIIKTCHMTEEFP